MKGQSAPNNKIGCKLRKLIIISCCASDVGPLCWNWMFFQFSHFVVVWRSKLYGRSVAGWVCCCHTYDQVFYRSQLSVFWTWQAEKQHPKQKISFLRFFPIYLRFHHWKNSTFHSSVCFFKRPYHRFLLSLTLVTK